VSSQLVVSERYLRETFAIVVRVALSACAWKFVCEFLGIIFQHAFGCGKRQYGPTPYRFLHSIAIRLQIEMPIRS